jgi:uncharacterized protein (TIGR03083 family)
VRADPPLLASAYDGIAVVVDGLTEPDLRRPTRCRGWTVADLMFHLLLDAQRALVALASPADDEPDVDAVTYWAPHKPAAPWAGEHEEFVRRATAAYSTPDTVVQFWRRTAAAVPRAASLVALDARVTTQGHVLTVADLLSTLVVEAVVHHLDLTVDLPDAPPPDDAVLAHVRDVFDAMLGAPSPSRWRTVDYVLAATGRTDAAMLQPPSPETTARFPLLG